jgi:hypothetical protein
MSFIAVAIGGAAVVGGVTSIVGNNKAANAQKDALKQSTALEEQQIAEAKRQFDLQRGDLAPYREAGGVALGQIGRGTADGAEFNRKFTQADFVADPGYEFRRSEGQRGVEASAAARGGILSGGALRALSRYNSDFASNEFGRAFDRYQSDLGNRYNRLAGVAGVGQQAVASGNQASQNYTNERANSTNNMVNNAQSLGNVRASQYGGNAGAIAGAANTIGGLAGGFGGFGGGGGFNSELAKTRLVVGRG